MSSVEQLAEQDLKKGFDYRATINDPKTGKIVKVQNYTRHVTQAYGEFIERDGKFYHPGSNTQEIRDPRLPPTELVLESKVEKKPEVSVKRV